MYRSRRRFLQHASLMGAAFVLTACKRKEKPSPPLVNTTAAPVVDNELLKVAFVYPQPVGDFGWTYAHDLGRREMEVNLGYKVKTTFVESVKENTAEAERVIRQLAMAGNKLIFTTSLGYMNQTIKVAKDFPNIAFENCGGHLQAANVGTYLGRFEEPRYLTGMIAGKMTKSNVIGYIAAYPIPEVIRGINAFTQGLRATNPQAKVKVIWVESWSDSVKERDAAQTLINLHADVLTQHTDSVAVIQLAEEKGIYAVGYNADLSKFGGRAHLTSAIQKWGKFYTESAKAVLSGTWKSQDIWQGIGDDMVDISPLSEAIPVDVQELVRSKRQDFINETAHPFEGIIKDQTGTVRVLEGKVLDASAQLAMNWYVQGVEVSH